MRNRYYDPATGKFTQEDPIGLALQSAAVASATPEGRRRWWKRAWWSSFMGLHDRREDYAGNGWMYRQLARLSLGCTFVSMVLWWFHL
jgi:hypothetical protein